MTEDFHHHPRLHGVRVSYIASDKNHMTRAIEDGLIDHLPTHRPLT